MVRVVSSRPGEERPSAQEPRPKGNWLLTGIEYVDAKLPLVCVLCHPLTSFIVIDKSDLQTAVVGLTRDCFNLPEDEFKIIWISKVFYGDPISQHILQA